MGQTVTQPRTPRRTAARAPELDEQTDEMEEMVAELGFGKHEIAELRQRRAL